jgi:hypothetical protein
MEDKEEKDDYEEENREYMKEILQTIKKKFMFGILCGIL